jgi:hypothetical protein
MLLLVAPGERWVKEIPMAAREEQAYTSSLGFVAFVFVITAIAVLLTLSQIYLQNPS